MATGMYQLFLYIPTKEKQEMKRFLLMSLAFASVCVVQAKVTLPQLFQSGMVVQRDKSIPVWGFADRGEQVTITFKKKVYKTIANEQGRWRIDIPKQKYGGPFEMQVNDIIISDILIGDVWLCSGQSNIDVTIERVHPQYSDEMFTYANDQIRLFRVQNDEETHGPKGDIRPTSWKHLNKQNAWFFSAVGYFLGREMYEKKGVPQGIIVNSRGGTPIQAWLDADTLKNNFPMQYRRTQFYQDDEMVRTMQRANQLSLGRWQKVMDEGDPGLSEGFANRDFDDSDWITKYQYDNLSDSRGYQGSFWARQQVKVDAAHAGQAARLLVGTLYDADYTYVNGKEVGRTSYQYPPRRYTIPVGLLKEGNNALSIRFVTRGGNPHFIKDKPYKLIFDDGFEIPLSTEWRVHEGARMSYCPQVDVNVANLPAVLYNAMLHPLAPYALSGVVWYQGESNTDDGNIYEQMLTELVSGWRQLWQAPDLPFVIVQLANFMEASDKPQDTGWSRIREAQRLATHHIPNTALACIIDLGEAVDIHPLRKREVAQRVAMGFEHLLWNKKLLLSPQVVSSQTDGNDVVLTLDQPLRSDGVLEEFEVAAADGRFVNAKATGQGNRITIQSPVSVPKSVRYAWKNNPAKANAFGKNDLPMSPFQLVIGQD